MADIFGTSGDDTLNGTSNNDNIYGLAENDVLNGSAGDDLLDGGTGADTMVGGLGNDTLIVDSFDTVVQGDSGIDTMTVLGTAGVSLNILGASIEIVNGGSGDDNFTTFLNQPQPPPSINDYYLARTIHGNDGNDVLQGVYADNDALYGDNGNDVLDGWLGADSLSGGAGDDRLIGWSDGNAGDTLLGGTGDDIYEVDSADIIVESADEGMDTVIVGSSHTLGENLENLTMTMWYATGDLTGNVLNNVLTGNETANVLTGHAGNDALIGGAGNDTYVFNLGDGVDSIQDTVITAEGNRIRFGSGITAQSLQFLQEAGALRINVGPNGDAIQLLNFDHTQPNGSVVQLVEFADGTTANLQDLLNGTGPLNPIIGTTGNDFLLGTSQADDIQGLGGNDSLFGAEGNDVLQGGAGNDTLQGDAGNDMLNGGVGDDLLQDWSGNDTYMWGLGGGTDTVQDWGAFNEVDTVQLTVGGTLSTLLVTQDFASNFGAVTLRMAQSDDQLVIGTSIEQIRFADGILWDQAAILAHLLQGQTGTSGNEILGGTFQGDYLQGLGGNDTLFGADGHDALMGGPGNDQLHGDAGNDVLNGGAGNDVLQDWSGSDTYVFGMGSGQDTVQDWGWDVTDVDTVLVTGGVAPNSLFVTQDWATNPGGLTLRFVQSDDQLIIQNLNSIEQIQFADGTVWDSAAIQARVYQVLAGTASGESLSGRMPHNYLDGRGGDDWLFGNIDSDVLIGGAGNDQLFGGVGEDVLHGGSGNDQLYGDMGSDTYVFGVGSGTDTVQDWGGDVTDVDTVLVTGGVTPNLVLIVQDIAQNFGAVTLRLAQSNEQLVIGNSIERIQFADGTMWDQVMIQARLQQGQTGTAGNDFLSGGANSYLDGRGGDDTLFGSVGNDALMGGSGNDQLQGWSGDDVFNGGAGNDQLQDFAGNDTYVWGQGSGIDTVQDLGAFTETDTVFVTSGVTPTALFVTQDWVMNPGGLILRLAQSDDQLVIRNFNSIEQIQFDDGTVWDQATMQARLQQVQTGTSSNDVLSGGFQGDYLQGLEGDDTLFGGDGHDALMGGVGNDQLQGDAGNDVFYGGTGNDVLQDFGGNDTYVWGEGSGQDTVQDWGLNEIDTVQLTYGITPSMLLITQDFSQNFGAVTLRLAQSDDQLIIQNFNSIEQIQFGDGTVWDQATIQARLQQGQTGTSGDDSLSGFAVNNYLQGEAGDDILNGNSGMDALFGGSGNDQLYGGMGDDVLNGGSGNDQLQDFAGNDTYVWGQGSGIDTVQDLGTFTETDTVFMTSGVTPTTLFVTQDWVTNPGGLILRLAQSDDQLVIQNVNSIEQIQFADGTVWDQAAIQLRLQHSMTGTEGDDYLWGSTESNYIQGLGGNDSLYGNDGNDVLQGGTGDDFLDGGLGDDVYDGGLGNDIYLVDQVGDSVTELTNEGTDTVQSSLAYTLGANVENLVLVGSAQDATGNEFSNILTGNAQNNRLDGGLGADTMIGGQGNDMYVVDHVGDAVTEGVNEGADTVEASINYSLEADVENLVLVEAALNATGNDLNNVLVGNAQNNRLDGGLGADSMSGGAGDDTYLVDNVSDSVVEAAGNGADLVQASVSHTLSSNVENLTLTGSAAINGTGNALNNILTGNNAANMLTGGGGNDTYVIGAGDAVMENANEGIDLVQSDDSFTLSANVENLTLIGTLAINGTGNQLDNVLIGNSAANTLTGGAGDDTYVIGSGDTVVEASNGGTDTVQSNITYTLGNNVENLTLTGISAINGTGNSLNNLLVGNSAANTLTGGTGNDTYVVGAGDTIVESNNGGTDTVQTSVTWTLGSNLENLTLIGTAAINGTGNGSANVMNGNSAANVLSGAGGNDQLRGGQGDDTANGGGGNDTYLFGRGEGQDLVQDNSGSADKVLYDTGINPIDLVISRQANDLRLSIHDSTDYVTVQNWYISSSNRIETVQAGNGQTLLSTQVDQLIQAMASFSQQTGLTWDQAIDQQPQQVQSILAASWQ